MNIKEYRDETVRGINVALQSVEDNKIESLVKVIKGSNRVFFTGAGRSFLMIKAIAMAMMQVGVPVHVTGEVSTPSITPDDLLIVASCSGETQSVQLFVDQAKKLGAKIALLTGNSASTMAQSADVVLEMACRPEPGSVQEGWITDNRFEQAIVPFGDCIVEYLARLDGASGATIGANHANME